MDYRKDLLLASAARLYSMGVDLEAARERLRQLGVTEDRISVSDLCTMCMPDVFWSHRATNGRRGVQAAVITL